MNADRWKQIDELFDYVLDVPEGEREKFLSAKCNGDDELKREVWQLLKANSAAGNLMENPAMEMLGESLARQETIAVRANLSNKRIGTYKIVKLLGAGGMGEVFLAADEKLKRDIALKILPAEYTAQDERVKRFELEARAISCLNHPNIVTIHDLGNCGGVNYIATEFVEGKTLRELQGGRLTVNEILNIAIQICEALAAAHRAGITHRDIKPENIMVRPDGYAKVLDFGLAKLNSSASPHSENDLAKTAHGMIVGTPAYMSPAQVAGEAVDYRTDLWSVGVVLFELLTGVNPFKKESRPTTFQAILSETPPPADSLNPQISAELNRVLMKLLEKDADLGYQTAADLRADLKRVIREYDSSASLILKSGLPKNAFAVMQKYVLLSVVFLLISALAVSGFWYFSRNDEPQNNQAVDWSKATNLQLTEQAGIEFFPSLAPDGKSFVYTANHQGNFDIYTRRVGGKLPRNLTEDSPANDTQPAFSPDGELIAFRSEREPKGIYVMGATGENLRRVADFGFHPSWSPDGKEIVVSTFGLDQPHVRVGRNNAIWIINVETGARRELIKTEGSFPVWSPDGKRIAFWFYPPGLGRRDIATVPVAGGEPILVTKDFAVSNWNPVWSPDGSFLYFVSDRNGNQNFWRVRIDQSSGEVLSQPEPVTTPSKYSRHLSFSRDGRRMIYVQTTNQSNLQGVEFDPKNETTVGEPFWITRGDREITRAELSPDGKQFLMRQIRRTQDDLVIVNRDGNTWRDVTSDAPFDRFPRWSPDGKQIAFASDRSGNYEIWISNADGTNLRQATFTGVNSTGTSFPIWSPDGKELIYAADGQSFIINPGKGWNEQTPKKISAPENLPAFAAWDWSSDGKKLAGTFGPGLRAVGFYSFENNSFEELAEARNSIPSWLPNSRSLIYASENKIFLVNTETKKTKELLTLGNDQLRSPFVSRDGRLLYYTVHLNESDVWLLDNSKTE